MERTESPRTQRNRARIAQATARLIAEHGLTDWGLAKRKACRQLGLSERDGLPGNDEVEQALRDYNTLFRSADQPARLREQRAEALRWMERLSAWNPVLIGAVAAGWATAHSEIHLELEAEDAKVVELALINAGVSYAPAPAAAATPDRIHLHVEGTQGRLRLIIVSPRERRNRPRRESSAGAAERLSPAQLRALLESGAAT